MAPDTAAEPTAFQEKLFWYPRAMKSPCWMIEPIAATTAPTTAKTASEVNKPTLATAAPKVAKVVPARAPRTASPTPAVTTATTTAITTMMMIMMMLPQPPLGCGGGGVFRLGSVLPTISDSE